MATATHRPSTCLRGAFVNDLHSGLNPTRVAVVRRPRTESEVQDLVRSAAARGRRLSLSGARHAMGGQAFAEGEELVDLRALSGIRRLDLDTGLATVGAGTNWRRLLAELELLQRGEEAPWTFRQKQTGADRLTLGGAVAANVHGRGLNLPPFVSEVESLRLVGPDGQAAELSRERDGDLFRLNVGGYGLFGVVSELGLRLVRRLTLERVVRLARAEELAGLLERRLRAGFLFGDFQLAIDPASPDFLRSGIFSCYRPAPERTLPTRERAALKPADWLELLRLAHVDKSRAFERYAAHYLATDGQCYHSDEAQLTTYIEGYHGRLGMTGGEVLAELFVPRPALPSFLEAAADRLREHEADPVYGTVRWTERDAETALAWARQPWACVVLNLHVEHDACSVERARRAVRALHDEALRRGGSFYLTYQRWATRDQLLVAHPRLQEVLLESRRRDPRGVFESDWRRALECLLWPEGRGGTPQTPQTPQTSART